jgi:hypothetical protein
MPKCAWLLLAVLALLLHHSIGLAETINLALAAIVWAASTPAALIAIGALAFWHLANHHTPRTVHAHH